jgi:RNA polymerase sigma factor (sigma-70 family)
MTQNQNYLAEQTTETIDISFPATTLGRSDADLVRNCRGGDQSAWNELVDRYQRLIFAIPRRAGLSEDQASDIFQEVFVLLFERLDEIRQPEKLRSWLVTTAKFKTWAVVRTDKKSMNAETAEEMEFEMSNIPDNSALAEENILRLEQQHLVRTALGKLDDRCQKILSMLYLRDSAASYSEVAEAIAVGETSISPLRSRCLKKLEKLLAG